LVTLQAIQKGLRRRRDCLDSQFSGGSHRVFQLAVLDLFLAGDTVRRPGQSLKAFGTNLFSAMLALTECSVFQTVQGLPDKVELGMTIRALAENQFLLVRLDSLIGDILQVVGDGFAALFDGGQHGFLQKLPLLEELLFKAPGRW
jgi:hypothetical protein